MQIRHANPTRDAAECAAIYAPFVAHTVASLEERPPSRRELAERIERISRTYPWLVGVIDDAMIGYAYASRHRERAAYRWAVDVAVYVASAHQRRGVGRALYGALLPLLAAQGLHVACAGVTLPNDASVALHESFGFTAVGIYRRIGWKAGAWRDVGWWQLDLQGPIPNLGASSGPGAGSASAGPPAEPGAPMRLPAPPSD